MKEARIKLNDFMIEAQALIEEMNALIDTLPDKGLKCSESQKICLKQAASHLENNINGLEENDFTK